jgi:hypothetical protein
VKAGATRTGDLFADFFGAGAVLRAAGAGAVAATFFFGAGFLGAAFAGLAGDRVRAPAFTPLPGFFAGAAFAGFSFLLMAAVA